MPRPFQKSTSLRSARDCSNVSRVPSGVIDANRPPNAVQTVLTAVAIMLGHQEPNWAEVRRVSKHRSHGTCCVVLRATRNGVGLSAFRCCRMRS